MIYKITLPLLLCVSIYAMNQEPIGNFANNRNPNTYFGFGQNIFAQGSIVPYLSLAQQKGSGQNYITLTPEVVYAFTNNFSLDVTLPIVPLFDQNNCKGHGVGDLTAQLEYAFYGKQEKTFYNEATIVTNVTLPFTHISSTKSVEELSAISNGGVSFFIGSTLSHLSIKWYTYIAAGAVLTTSRKNTKIGNTILYQGGFGRNLGNPGGITLALLIDINGVFSAKNKVCSVTNHNSGGNEIFLGPTLYIAYHNFEGVAGIEFLPYQHQNGTQSKQKFRSIFSGSIKF